MFVTFSLCFNWPVELELGVSWHACSSCSNLLHFRVLSSLSNVSKFVNVTIERTKTCSYCFGSSQVMHSGLSTPSGHAASLYGPTLMTPLTAPTALPIVSASSGGKLLTLSISSSSGIVVEAVVDSSSPLDQPSRTARQPQRQRHPRLPAREYAGQHDLTVRSNLLLLQNIGQLRVFEVQCGYGTIHCLFENMQANLVLTSAAIC